MTNIPACDHLRADHRELERHLDRLMDALQRLTAEDVPRVAGAVSEIRHLSAVHFEKEETIFYPELRPALSGLISQMDQQHEEIREWEENVAEILSDPPLAPDSRWLNGLRTAAIQFHDYIQHHIVDEEDNLFRIAASLLSGDDQERLALRMSELHRRTRQA